MLSKRSLLVTALLLLSSTALANNMVDAKTKLSFQELMINADRQGINPHEILTQVAEFHIDGVALALETLITKTPKQAEELSSTAFLLAPSRMERILVAALSAAPEQADGIISSAFRVNFGHEKAITAIASASGVSNDIIIRASISAGKDPTAVGLATAAGTKEKQIAH